MTETELLVWATQEARSTFEALEARLKEYGAQLIVRLTFGTDGVACGLVLEAPLGPQAGLAVVKRPEKDADQVRLVNAANGRRASA